MKANFATKDKWCEINFSRTMYFISTKWIYSAKWICCAKWIAILQNCNNLASVNARNGGALNKHLIEQ